MIFILNKQERVVNILRNGGGANQAPPFFDDIYSQDLATGAETFSFSTVAINNVARDLVVGNYVAFKDDDGQYRLFQITQTEEYHEDAMYMSVYAEGAGLELINKVFRARKAPSTSLRKFMEMVLDDTGWNVGTIPFSIQESLDLELEDATVYSTLQTNLIKYGVEMAFRCEINNGRISSKYVDLYTHRGRVTGKRFTFGRDIEGIRRKVDSTELFTALIGRGNRGTNFKDVTVSGINKPLGQDFVADQEAYDRYNNNGYHIIGIFNYDTDSPEELLRETYKQLEKCKVPKIEYEISVALLGELLGEKWNKVRIGDTVAIVDNSFNPPIHLMARVSKLDRSFTNNQSDTCTLANFIEVQSNITDEMRKLASELEGYVDGALGSKFPIDSDDIDKGAIKQDHIYQNSIIADHIVADEIKARHIETDAIRANHILAGEIKADHIDSKQIKADHIDAGEIKAYHIETGSITADSGIIGDLAVGTGQIADLAVTVGKVQNLFVQDLVATQGKFESAHIGVLTSDNIDAKTIKAEHIVASVIDAINLNVEGKISADRIDVGSIKVENIDAGKITTGTLNADRIGANSIDASKIIISDFTNLATKFQDKNNVDKVYNIVNRNTVLSDSYIASDLDEDSEFIFECYCKTFDNTTTLSIRAQIWVYYADGTIKYNSTELGKANECRGFIKKSATVKIGKHNDKIPIKFVPVLLISKPSANTTVEKWQIKQLSVRRKNNGKLIVDGSIKANHLDIGSITTDKLDSNAITAELITSSVIKAINMSVEKIEAKNIDTENLKVNGSLIAGDITADAIKSNVISAINSYAGTMKIKQGQIEKLTVGSANITDLDVSKLTGEKIDAKFIDVEKIKIKDANITGTINASKISGGTLDASKMTVKNLKADSITAGAITIQGANLLLNSKWKLEDDIKWWSGSNWILDNSQEYEGCGVRKISKTGLTADTNQYLIGCNNINGTNTGYKCNAGEAYVVSGKFKVPSNHGIDGAKPYLGIWFYSVNSNGTLSTVQTSYSFIDLSLTDEWQTITHTAKAPSNAVYVKWVANFRRNGTLYVTQPMFSKGNIASIYQPNTDELISDGAIDTDKIKDEAVGADKLNVNELFVGDNAFIKKLQAVEIDASNITTGTISNDRIDIKGLISFESLNQDMQRVFDVQGDKTYINGGMIATNTIKADKIDLLSGITVKGKDNTTTFSIANNGEVEVNGLVKSGNFDKDKNTGYRLSTDGMAILNQAVVRGDVVLPNAGMTNFGATLGNENLLVDSEFIHGDKYWVAHNSKITIPVIDTNFKFEGSNTLKISKSGVTEINYGGLSQLNKKAMAGCKTGDVFTVSFYAYTNNNSEIDEGFAFQLKTSENTTLGNYTLYKGSQLPNKTWTRFSYTFTATTSTNNILPYFWVKKNGTVWFSRAKIEKGSELTPYCPYSKDQINYTRIWAGASYENRDNAPFRVTQKGDVYATNGTFSGKMYGNLDSGLVHIHNNEIVINSISTYMNEDGVVRSVQSRDYNPNPYFRLGAGTSLLNTDLIFGSETDRKVEFLNNNREFNFNNTALNLKSPTRTSGANVFFNPKGGYNSAFGVESVISNTDANLTIGYHNGTWANTTIITHNGSRGGVNGDICFKRSDNTEDLNVSVQGNVKIKNSIQSSIQNIEMRSVKNEGWGFYAI